MFNRASDLDKLLFTKYLAEMLKSGIPLDEAISTAREQSKNKYFQKILAKIEESVKTDGTLNKAEEQGASVTQTPNKALKEDSHQSPNQASNLQQERSKTSEPSPPSGIYKSLMEQQALLLHIKDGSAETINRGGKIVLKDEAISALLKTHKIQDSCSERLCRMNSEIQSLKDYSQEMKSLASRRQKERGFEM